MPGFLIIDVPPEEMNLKLREFWAEIADGLCRTCSKRRIPSDVETKIAVRKKRSATRSYISTNGPILTPGKGVNVVPK